MPPARHLRILHAIHDFLPRHRAGSEIYTLRLAQELAREHHVHVLCADHEPTLPHGTLSWRTYGGLPVTDLINNWIFASFEDTYESSLLNRAMEHVLMAVQPDVLHMHSVINLSMDLPAIARRHGIPTVAILHDHSLLCPSGGQRLHAAEQHVCTEIQPDRCRRCFIESPFRAQMAYGNLVLRAPGSRLATKIGRLIRARRPSLFGTLGRAVASAPAAPVSASSIERRLARAKRLFDEVELFVAPSKSLGREFVRQGLPERKLIVSDYGFAPFAPYSRSSKPGPIAIGFVGTLTWHKGCHVLLDAIAKLPRDRILLRVFGDQDTFPSYAAELRRQADGLPVEFMGPFGEDDASSAYGQLDVLVVPSLWPENSPLVIHEARMASVPVVASRMGGIPELVTDGLDGLLYDAFSSDALAAALRRLIDEPGLMPLLAQAHRPAKTIAQDASEWEGIYRHTLGQASAP